MKALGILVFFFVVMLFAGLVAGWGVGYSIGSGNPLPAIGGFLLAGGICYAIYRFRPKQGEMREILDMLFGDMDDPEQRSIMIRIAIAAFAHAMSMAPSMIFEKSAEGPVNFADGLTQPELKQVAYVAFFVITLLWVIYESYRFYSIDEFWRRISLGPLAFAGSIVFLLVVFGNVFENALGTPEVSVHMVYFTYWISMMIGFFRSYRMNG